MDILISNLLSALIFDIGKWSNWKYANTRFGQYLKKSKNGFSNVLTKSDLAGVGYIFCPKKLLLKPNFLKYAQVLVVACRKPKSNIAR